MKKVEEPDLTRDYSYAEYLRLTIDGMVELIKGKLFKMAPSPNRNHQTIAVSLSGEIYHYLKGKPCEVYTAPFDVRFFEPGKSADEQITTVVQPDICIVCDPKKLDKQGCIGAPNMIVEILSPSTASRDLDIKYKLYEENGVKEYWIVQPNDQTVSIFDLDENINLYILRGIYSNQNSVIVKAIGLKIDLREIFPPLE